MPIQESVQSNLGGFNIEDTTYNGTYADFIITNATFGLNTVDKGVAFVKSGIKVRHTIERMDYVYPLMQRVPTPVADSGRTISFDGVILEPQDMMGYLPLLPAQFENHNYFAEELSEQLLSREMPLTPTNYLLQLYMNRCFEQNEIGIHQGSVLYGTTSGSTYAGAVAGSATAVGQIMFFNGIIPQLLSAGTYDATSNPRGYINGDPLGVGGTSALTVSNIETTLNYMLSSLPQAISLNPTRVKRLKYCMSMTDWRLYEAFLTTSSVYKNNDTTQGGVARYKDIPIVTLGGIPEGTIYLGEFTSDPMSNIYIGLNSSEDMKLELRPLQNNSEYWFIKYLFKMAVAVPKANEFVLFTTKTSASFL